MIHQRPLPNLETIRTRLIEIFPEGISDRNYLIRDMAVKGVYVMLYIDAVEGNGIWLAPKHIYRMTEEQSKIVTLKAREMYRTVALKPGFSPVGSRWYADNTREPIRDETLRDGLVRIGAVVVDESVPTTSSKGRYALNRDFADLFCVTDLEFHHSVDVWRKNYLSKGALAKVRILQEQKGTNDIEVCFPGGERRIMEAGPSSVISKAVIEEFSTRFLNQPVVLWLSQSGNKVVLQDEKRMKDLGLPIDQTQLLPDLVVADLGRDPILLIFIEVVASDGPVTGARKTQFLKLTDTAGYESDQIVFLSAFSQRNASPLKRRLDSLAVDSAVWCMAEPDLLIWLGEKIRNPFSPVK